MSLRYLFVDMNSYFASVEQQVRPELRGKPVGVVPVMADTSCCIAASVEAKTLGIRTGTPIWEARKICPGITLLLARHDLYVRMHEKIVKAVGRCVPVTLVMSIDEMKCKLLGAEREPAAAVDLGHRVKAAIKQDAGDWMRCSVGLAPNAILAKVASKQMKPDGLTVFPQDALPERLPKLKLTDFPGIGPRMERRFHKFGICTVAQLLALTPGQMCTIWGSRVHGWRWWYTLRGDDVPDAPTRTRTVGHSHVLPPELRTDEGARQVIVKLIHKAAARLRKMDYWAGNIVVSVYHIGDPGNPWDGGGWAAGTSVPHCQDTLSFLHAAAALWEAKPPAKPMKVGIVLADLVPSRSATPSLFGVDRQTNDLCHMMDRVNRAFGPNTVYFGGMYGQTNSAPMRISFTHIPDEETESAAVPRRYGWG